MISPYVKSTLYAYWLTANLPWLRLVFLVVFGITLRYGGRDPENFIFILLIPLFFCVIAGFLENRHGFKFAARRAGRACQRTAEHRSHGCVCISEEALRRGRLDPKDLIPVLKRLNNTEGNRAAKEILDRILALACLLLPYSPLGAALFGDVGKPEKLELGALIGTGFWVMRTHMLLAEAGGVAMQYLSLLWVAILVALLKAGDFVLQGDALKHLTCIISAALILVLYRWIAFVGLRKIQTAAGEDLLAEFIFELGAAIQLIVLATISFRIMREDELVLTGFIVAHFVICVGLSLNVLWIVSIRRPAPSAKSAAHAAGGD